MDELTEPNVIIEEIDEFLAPLLGITPQQAAFDRLMAQKLNEKRGGEIMIKHFTKESTNEVVLVPIIATKDYTLDPDTFTKVETKIDGAVPPNCDVIVRPLDCMKSSNLIVGERTYTKSYVAFVNLAHGNYWDGLYGEFDGRIYDVDGGKCPPGFFKEGELYAIDYDIYKGDVVAMGEVIPR